MSLQQTIKPLTSALEKMPQKTIATAISIALLLYIAFLLAKMTWLFVPNNSAANQLQVPVKAQNNNRSESGVDVNRIKALNLFGQFNAQAKPDTTTQVSDVPQTRLRLTLAGVVASSEPSVASAIIESSGSQYTYGIGDKIENTRATLEQVYADRVIIKQSGQLETLMLDGVKYNKVISQNTRAPSKRPERPKKIASNRGNERSLAQQATVLKKDLKENPAKLTDYLQITSHLVDGQLAGYRLSPGKNAEFFKASGLKAGDIAVQVNGLDLTSPESAAEAIQLLRTESQILLLVDRGNELTEIVFSTN